MKAFLLLFFVVETINGFGIQMARIPFQMEFEMPAFPAMSAMPAMPFPPIFNPMEAMERETMEGETRGLDDFANITDMANITTKNNTETKDGFKVTTITRDGPGFHSYIKEYQKEGNSSSNGTSGGPADLAKLMGGPNLMDIIKQLKLNSTPKKQKCKKCGKGKFCDPLFHLCRKKFSEGRTCMFQKQCGKKLKCQWGKCQKAKAGDAGTFCKSNSQCNGNACCRATPGSFHTMCIPLQAEGAICGLNQGPGGASSFLMLVKRSAPTCSPCEKGLKCAETGESDFKRCVQMDYVEGTKEEKEGDNPTLDGEREELIKEEKKLNDSKTKKNDDENEEEDDEDDDHEFSGSKVESATDKTMPIKKGNGNDKKRGKSL